MPLRDLFYICSEYQKLVDKKSLYSSTLQKIPAPNFIEFYNGSTTAPDCTELRLSSAFEHLSGEPKLELIVTVLNVNEGHNADLMQHCNTLNEYAQYVARVRLYAADMSLDQAVERAVDECIREGILAEFLTCNRNEVISMSIFEYDKELEEKKLRKAEYEAGFSEGEKHGIELNSIETARRMLKFSEFSLEKIAAISSVGQVLCITHLPQIAAFADNHIHIEKQSADGRTVTQLTTLDYNGRLQELVRMTAGATASRAAFESATELLQGAEQIKSSLKRLQEK